MKTMKPGQYFALFTGIFFIVFGVLGFIPALQHPINVIEARDGVEVQLGYLFGLFPVNPIENGIYIIVGILGLVAAIGLGGARIYGRSLAFFFGLLAAFGLVPGFSTGFGLIPIFGNDVWLHAIVAAISFYYGFIDSPGLLEIASQPPQNSAATGGR
jgi:Domain of unknown function (DUF4383)